MWTVTLVEPMGAAEYHASSDLAILFDLREDWGRWFRLPTLPDISFDPEYGHSSWHYTRVWRAGGKPS